MTTRGRLALLWTTVAVALAGIAAALWGPMEMAWRGHRLHARGERVEAELLRVQDDGTLVLRLPADGPGPHACTAAPGAATREAPEPGRRLEVIRLPQRPERCVLVSTLQTSRALLWQISGLAALLALGLLALAIWVHRSLTVPARPARRMRGAGPVRCPACGAAMAEGCLPLLGALHWRAVGEPIGLPHAFGGLPGTVGWKGRPVLHAFRCASCEIVTLQYGRPRT